MKKDIILFVAIFLVLSMIAGGTYAYWRWVNVENTSVVFNTVSSDISKYITYDAGESHFVGNFQPTISFCDGMSNTISFSKKEQIADRELTATIKMNINAIGNNIKNSNSVYWVVTSGDSSSCDGVLDNAVASGTFNNVSANSVLTLKENIKITLNEQKYTIWIWVNQYGSDISNLSGETIDVNIWTQIDMGDYTGNNQTVVKAAGLYDDNGVFTSWDELVSTGKITVSGTKITNSDRYNLSGELIIPKGITVIGTGCLAASGITSVVLPTGITTIENNAFMVSSLRYINIPDGVTTIENSVFDSSSLDEIELPASLTSFGIDVFSYTMIGEITFKGTMSQWNELTFNKSWNYNNDVEKVICSDGTIDL